MDLRGRGRRLLDWSGLALWNLYTGPGTPRARFFALILFSTSGHFVQNTGGRGLVKGRLVSLSGAALAGARPLFRLTGLRLILCLFRAALVLLRFFLLLDFIQGLFPGGLFLVPEQVTERLIPMFGGALRGSRGLRL